MPRSQSIVNRRRPAPFVDKSLTITREEESGGDTLYRLDYPNREVRQSLYQKLLRALAPKAKVSKQAKQFHDALVSGDFDAMEKVLHAFFSDIPYQVYNPNDLAEFEGALSTDGADRRGLGRRSAVSQAMGCVCSPKLVPATGSADIAKFESVMYAFAMGTGLDVRAEESTNHGRIDLTIDAGTRIYVFELKVLKGDTKPGDAIQQIRDRGYVDKFRARGVPVYLVGVEFEPEDKNIKHFKYEAA